MSNKIVKGKVVKLIKSSPDAHIARTIKVEISESLRHAIYNKVIKNKKIVMCNNESFDVKIGDPVFIRACKKVSKTKSWELINISI